ncbi:MAG: glycosyltransferase family 2 protein, partial [Acidobacteria bacterium]|nr:glycosyltransferase family 2 protein [Acidobacteriota bacterium]
GTWAAIEALAQRDPRVRAIRFRRNFGKAAALDAGFKEARGDRVVTLDADLQDNPADVPRLLSKLEEGYDLVVGWKRRRYDPWHKVIPSRIFNWMIGVVSGVRLHDHNCGLKCYRAAVVREIRVYGEMHRFITLLADARGFRLTEMEVHHRPRSFGRSKYGAGRFIKGFLDLLTVSFLTGYAERPLHFLGVCGLLALAAGLAGLSYLAGLWALGFRPIGNRPVLIYSAAALLLGAQMLSVGILAELIASRVGGGDRNGDSGYSIERRLE